MRRAPQWKWPPGPIQFSVLLEGVMGAAVRLSMAISIFAIGPLGWAQSGGTEQTPKLLHPAIVLVTVKTQDLEGPGFSELGAGLWSINQGRMDLSVSRSNRAYKFIKGKVTDFSIEQRGGEDVSVFTLKADVAINVLGDLRSRTLMGDQSPGRTDVGGLMTLKLQPVTLELKPTTHYISVGLRSEGMLGYTQFENGLRKPRSGVVDLSGQIQFPGRVFLRPQFSQSVFGPGDLNWRAFDLSLEVDRKYGSGFATYGHRRAQGSEQFRLNRVAVGVRVHLLRGLK
jgi:hypothetical protein